MFQQKVRPCTFVGKLMNQANKELLHAAMWLGAGFDLSLIGLSMGSTDCASFLPASSNWYSQGETRKIFTRFVYEIYRTYFINGIVFAMCFKDIVIKKNISHEYMCVCARVYTILYGL